MEGGDTWEKRRALIDGATDSIQRCSNLPGADQSSAS